MKVLKIQLAFSDRILYTISRDFVCSISQEENDESFIVFTPSLGGWSSGKTTDSGSVIEGSIPSPPANKNNEQVYNLFFLFVFMITSA